MQRRFAIGEVFSNFFPAPNNEFRKKMLQLLESGEQSKEIIGIEILNASDFIRDSILESVQAKMLHFNKAQTA